MTAGDMTNRPIRLMIVDDHAVVRIGLASLFGTVAGVTVVGEAGSVAAALETARLCRPDVVLLDVRLPDGDGVQACRDMLSEQPNTRVIMLTSYADEDAVVAAILAGSSGYILKQANEEQLIEAVQTVAEGRSLLDPVVTDTVLQFMRKASTSTADPLTSLSRQERKILALLAEGKTNREIAETIILSEHTVRTYVSHIFRKLHFARRAEAAAFFTRLQLPA